MNERLYNGILIGILAISLGLLFFAKTSAITGHLTVGSTYSNVSIQKYLAIEMSDNLTSGIDFGSIEQLGIDNYNATKNYNGSGSSTLYWINVSLDSNTAVDLCTRANAPMNNGAGDVIGLGNQSFVSNVTSSDLNNPDLSNEVSFTISNQDGHLNVPRGNSSYWRFWLDAPLGQAVGTYNNTIYFEGYSAGTGC